MDREEFPPEMVLIFQNRVTCSFPTPDSVSSVPPSTVLLCSSGLSPVGKEEFIPRTLSTTSNLKCKHSYQVFIRISGGTTISI